ncbi:KRAB-A domain-containing protein 2-like [Stylophora pistillata]|uniref:KRAB-A domain-containing protein 2-like n=1 Tax=Stylophora pistillata TaxID=50429 RepID=UPI000C054792|nr:KRAB-A domain-containing protein 2-like [Stylophora pistillata]
MLKSSEVNKVVVEEFERTKGSGASKLACSLKDNFLGVSRAKIQTILNTDKSHYCRKANFLHKAKLKPIRVRDVHVRHQIDLMDMSRKGSVKMNGNLYRYVLTVIDVFSRFLWLRPPESKSSRVIANELECVYMEHGSPEIIQCDQGAEFKKALKTLCDRMNIKLIYSRPRHLQSQGKVERCHRTLRSKMEYDFQKMSQDGVNWAKQLPLYQRILNNDPKEVIAYKTPFEIYFARKCNAFRESRLQDEFLPSAGRVHPTKKDRNRRSRQALKLRKQA